jgi:PAS domain S-box-containing protein
VRRLRVNDDTPDGTYRILFDQSSMPLWVVAEETEEFLAVNDAVVAKYGWSRKELLCMRASDLLCHGEPLSSRAEYREYVPEGRPGVAVTGPHRHRRKDDARLDVRIEATRVTFEGRACLLCTVIDETGRRRLEERLEDSDRLWRALVDASPDVVLIVDPKGTVLFVNRVRTPFVGRTVVGAKIWDFAVDDSEARIRPVLRKLVETREAMRYEGPGLPAPDGTKLWYEVCAIPVVIDGSVERILWTATDITVRRIAVEKLAFQAALLSQVSQPVVATDGTGHVTYWSGAAERLYGWTQAEVLGKDVTELLRTKWLDPSGREGLIASVRATDAWQGELGHVTKRGEEIVVEVSVRLQRDEKHAVVGTIAVMSDVTARKSLEGQLRQSQKLEAIGLLAGGVAHDFNNLLAIIMGFSESSMRKLPPGHPIAEELREVIEAARRGGELTRKLLAFSRKQVMRPGALDVHTAVESFTRLLQRVVGEDVEVCVEREEGALVVRADDVQLEQVLLNLCTNARQAMPEGGRLLLRTRAAPLDAAFVARHPWSRAGSFAEIIVSDTGVGMDEATRARMFEPFFTTKPEGTGLGLATAYGIVQQHGGFVNVESAPGAGTTFRVYLPIVSGSAAHVASKARAVAEGARGDELILLAEDEPSLRLLVTTTLQNLGYRVIATGDGEEAVREFGLRSADIALAVLDVVLPRLDARQAYEQMRIIRPDVKVLFMTGYAPESTRMGALLKGAKIPLLEKPFLPSALAERVRGAIDGA